MASSQSTLPLFCKALLDRKDLTLKPELQEKLRTVVSRCETAHSVADSVIAYICGELSEAGVSSVLLKGQGIASWYPVPTVRQAGDIDLYVDDYEAACARMEKLFGPKLDESSKHASFHVGGTLYVEIHRFTETLGSRRQNAVYQRISDEGTRKDLTRRVIGGAEINTPEDTFNAFYVFHHLWHHVRSMGMGMRQLCDWAVFLHTHQGTLDTERLEGWLHELGLMDVWQVFGAAAVQAIGIDPEDVPFYDARKAGRAERLVALFLEQGDNMKFRHRGKKKGAVKHKAGSLAYIHKRLWKMFPIFPLEALRGYVRDILGGIKKLFK